LLTGYKNNPKFVILAPAGTILSPWDLLITILLPWHQLVQFCQVGHKTNHNFVPLTLAGHVLPLTESQRPKRSKPHLVNPVDFSPKLAQKAQLTFLQLCPKSAKPMLKNRGKMSENGSTKLTVKREQKTTGEFSAFLDQMRLCRI
jgi:hypothetical protein